MKKIKLFNYIAICITMCLLITGCMSFTDGKGFGVNYDRRTTGTIIDDQGLSLRAGNALTQDPELWKNCHITVLSYNNFILLVGQAPTRELKEKANNILLKFTKPEHIYNQITIEKPISLLARTKDSWITTQVKGKILANKNIGINRTKVITENGVVYLMGILTKTEEELATDIARQVPHVRQVIKIVTEHEEYDHSGE